MQMVALGGRLRFVMVGVESYLLVQLRVNYGKRSKNGSLVLI